MGAHKHIRELLGKKQSDVVLFSCESAGRPPAVRATQGSPLSKVVSFTGFVAAIVVVAAEAQFLRVRLTASLSAVVLTSGSLQSAAVERAGHRCWASRVLNSYWLGEDAT